MLPSFSSLLKAWNLCFLCEPVTWLRCGCTQHCSWSELWSWSMGICDGPKGNFSMNSSQLGKVCSCRDLKSCYPNGYHFINQLKAGSSIIWCFWEVCWATCRPILLFLQHWLPKLLIQYRSWLGAMSCFPSQQIWVHQEEEVFFPRCFFTLQDLWRKAITWFWKTHGSRIFWTALSSGKWQFYSHVSSI